VRKSQGAQGAQGAPGVQESDVPAHFARKGCPRCFGRGFVGRYADGRVAPCRCALLASLRELKKEKK